jgi:hypothetical protein
MKKHFLLSVAILVFNFSFSQTNSNIIDYIVVMKEGHNLDYTQKLLRDGIYYSFNLQNATLKDYVNSKPIFEISKEFPTARTPYLQRVYRISTNSEELLSSLNRRIEIESAERYVEPIPLNLPNDFNIPIDGERNTALDLIRAPMTWGISTGASNVFVGISDGPYEFTHEDLANKIQQNLNGLTATSTVGGNHGT